MERWLSWFQHSVNEGKITSMIRFLYSLAQMPALYPRPPTKADTPLDNKSTQKNDKGRLSRVAPLSDSKNFRDWWAESITEDNMQPRGMAAMTDDQVRIQIIWTETGSPMVNLLKKKKKKKTHTYIAAKGNLTWYFSF